MIILKYNDTFWHIYGDQLLAELGSIIKLNEDKFDFYVCYGGEEFIFIFNLENVLPILESLREQIVNHFSSKADDLIVSM